MRVAKGEQREGCREEVKMKETIRRENRIKDGSRIKKGKGRRGEEREERQGRLEEDCSSEGSMEPCT